MSEHTLGPWDRAKDDWWIYSKANGQMICQDIESDNEADYWLIAAAPDMLKVCRMIVDAVEGGDEISVVDAARAAIAKAENNA